MPQIAYITLLGAVVAVLSWNAAVGRIGPQNVALIGNVIPITAFAIAIVQGYRPGFMELLGASLTIGALLSFNLLSRNTRAPKGVTKFGAAFPDPKCAHPRMDESPARTVRAA